MQKIKMNKRTLIRWKVYVDRAKMYIGYINFVMLGIIFLKQFKDSSWGVYIFENYWFTFPLLIIVFVLFSLVLGFADTKMGIREEEMRNTASSNPILMEILEKVKRLEENSLPNNVS